MEYESNDDFFPDGIIGSQKMKAGKEKAMALGLDVPALASSVQDVVKCFIHG